MLACPENKGLVGKGNFKIIYNNGSQIWWDGNSALSEYFNKRKIDDIVIDKTINSSNTTNLFYFLLDDASKGQTDAENSANRILGVDKKIEMEL